MNADMISESSQHPCHPLVSVAVLAYNSSETIVETLESVKGQTYSNIELVISDDGSTDGTIEICRRWVAENKSRFVETRLIVSDANTGIPSNMNRALAECKGTWVKGVAGDDALMPDCIDDYMKYIRMNKEAEVLFSDVHIYQAEFKEANQKKLPSMRKTKITGKSISAKQQFEILLRCNPLRSGLSLMIKRGVYQKVGGYDESLRYWEDRPMLLKITKAGIRLHFVNTVAGKYRKHGKSVQETNSNRGIVNDFQLEVSQYYLKNYIKYLEPLERISVFLLHKRGLILDRCRLNKRIKVIERLYACSAYPWVWIVRRTCKKYQ